MPRSPIRTYVDRWDVRREIRLCLITIVRKVPVFSEHNVMEAGAYSGLAMGLSGLITALILPVLVAMFGL